MTFSRILDADLSFSKRTNGMFHDSYRSFVSNNLLAWHLCWTAGYTRNLSSRRASFFFLFFGRASRVAWWIPVRVVVIVAWKTAPPPAIDRQTPVCRAAFSLLDVSCWKYQSKRVLDVEWMSLVDLWKHFVTSWVEDFVSEVRICMWHVAKQAVDVFSLNYLLVFVGESHGRKLHEKRCRTNVALAKKGKTSE